MNVRSEYNNRMSYKIGGKKMFKKTKRSVRMSLPLEAMGYRFIIF